MSFTLAFITIIKADLLHPLNKLWMRFGLLISFIVTPIIIGLIYFGLFTPISIVMKLFGRDELKLKLANNTSFWKKKISNNEKTNDFLRQF